MNQYAGTLIVCVCFGVAASAAGGCDNATSGATGGASSTTGGTGTTTTGGTGVTTAGGSTPIGGTSSGGSGGAPTGTEVPLVVTATGFATYSTLGIQGAWYPYGDGIGADALPDGVCEAAGHMQSECSTITTPDPTTKSFANTNGIMCTSGTVAKVISMTAPVAPATTVAPDYSAIFGAGIGLDLNNGGLDGGTGKQPFNAMMANIIGVAFDMVDMTGAPAAVPLPGLRIEFPTPTTVNSAAIWGWQKAKNYTSPVVMGHNRILFTQVTQPDYVAGYSVATAPLHADQIVSVQFHVPTTTSAAGPYSFCVGNFSIITNP